MPAQYSAATWPAAFWSNIRSKFLQTASALNGSPSWNFTPSRRVKVQLVPDASGSHFSASSGSISALPALMPTRPSNI